MELTRNTRYPLSPDSDKFRLTVTPLWFLLTVVVASFQHGIKDVVGVVGSVAALFMFFFPGCMVAVTCWRRGVPAHSFLGGLLLSLGLIVFLINIVNTVYEHLGGHQHQTLTAWDML